MPSRVYIGRLHRHAEERDLIKFFKGYGRISEVLLKNGFGFVDFEDPRDADDAVYELDGRDLLGEKVVVQHAKGTPRSHKYGAPTRTGYRLIVDNLSSSIKWRDLKDLMRKVGEVTYADAHERRNEGVVEFTSRRDLERAIDKYNGYELNGRKLILIDDSIKSRSQSRRRSRSRSRDRKNRRSRSQQSSTSSRRSPSNESRGVKTSQINEINKGDESKRGSQEEREALLDSHRSRSRSRDPSNQSRSDTEKKTLKRSRSPNSDRSVSRSERSHSNSPSPKRRRDSSHQNSRSP